MSSSTRRLYVPNRHVKYYGRKHRNNYATRNNRRVTDVTRDNVVQSDRENVHTLQKTGNESGILILPQHERIRMQIRTKYLNKEEKKTIEQIYKLLRILITFFT